MHKDPAERSIQIGHIDPECDVVHIINDAYESARFLCERYYCVAPALNLKCVNTKMNSNSVVVTLVPLHLYYVVFELIKVSKNYSEKRRLIVYFCNF